MNTDMLAVRQELLAWMRRQPEAIRSQAAKIAENLKLHAAAPITRDIIEMFKLMIAELKRLIRPAEQQSPSVGIDDAVALAAEIALSPA